MQNVPLFAWAQVVRVDYGSASWMMTAMAAGSLGWGLRDALKVQQRRTG